VIYNTAGEEIKNIMGNWNLDIENNLISITQIDPFLPQELGPKGTAGHFISPEKLKNTGDVITSFNNAFVKYFGEWAKTSVTGQAGLFESNYYHAAPGKAAHCEFQLPVKESGTYKICLMYFPKEENASNAKITVKGALEEEVMEWNFKKGDRWGFAVIVGEYYLDKDKPASVTISNTGADGFIVSDGVGFIKVD